MDESELESVPLPPQSKQTSEVNAEHAPMVAVGFAERAPDAAPAGTNGIDASDAYTSTEVDSSFQLEPDCEAAFEGEAALPPISTNSSFNLLPTEHATTSNTNSSYPAAYAEDDIDATVKQIERSSSANIKKKSLGFAMPDETVEVTSQQLAGVSTTPAGGEQSTTSNADALSNEPLLKKKKKKKGVGFASFAVDDAPAEDGGAAPAPAPRSASFADAEADTAPMPAGVGAGAHGPGQTTTVEKLDKKKKKGVGFASFSLDTSTGFDSTNEAHARIAATPAAMTSPRGGGIARGGGGGDGDDPLEDSIELGKAEAFPGDSNSPKAARSNTRFSFDEGTATGTATGASSSSAAVVFEERDESDLLPLGVGSGADDNEKDMGGRFSRPSSAGSTRSRGGGSAGDAGEGTATELQDVTYMASAAQFRRIERANRHYSIACDVWCGIEETRNQSRGIATLVAAACVVPLTVAAVCYCSWLLNDMESGVNKALHCLSAVVAFSIQAILIIESFSSIVCEIEFGVVVSEEMPVLYTKAIVSTSVCTVIAQEIMFAAHDAYFAGDALGLSNPIHRAWLGLLLAGFIGSMIPVAITFFRHAPAMINSEMKWVYAYWTAGCCTCLLIVPGLYVLFAMLLATYGHEGSGAMGAVLAFLFPLLTPCVKMLTHEYAHWGEGRQRLYDGAVLDILLDSIHAAVLCLLVLDIRFAELDLVLLLVSQATCYCVRVLHLLSASTTGISMFDGLVPCLTNSKIGIKESPLSSPTKYRVADCAPNDAHVPHGISMDSMESYPFVKQCAKLRDITSLLCSLVLGTAISLVFVFFTVIVSATHNDAAFAGPGLWVIARQDIGESSMSGSFWRLIILFCFQLCIFVITLYWMQSNGAAVGVLLYQLEFNLSQMLAAAATYAVVAVLGAVLHGNGMNA